MRVVTSGLTFLDIDAYAGCVAYTELLNHQGTEAIAFSSAQMNESITETIRSWDTAFSADYIPTDKDSFILVDVSEPEFVEKKVDLDRVVEVIDHHVGFEKFWEKRIGDAADIEFLGAACTQVYERWKTYGITNISKTSARLLTAGILDNTLNFKADVTIDRDRQAYEELMSIAELPSDWPAKYFSECESAIYADIPAAIQNDTKIMSFSKLTLKNIAVGQLVVWNARKLIDEYLDTLTGAMAESGHAWFINLVSISEGKSYFVTKDPMVKAWAASLTGQGFNYDVSVQQRLWLRKEIVKEDLQ